MMCLTDLTLTETAQHIKHKTFLSLISWWSTSKFACSKHDGGSFILKGEQEPVSSLHFFMGRWWTKLTFAKISFTIIIPISFWLSTNPIISRLLSHRLLRAPVKSHYSTLKYSRTTTGSPTRETTATTTTNAKGLNFLWPLMRFYGWSIFSTLCSQQSNLSVKAFRYISRARIYLTFFLPIFF